MSRLFPVVFGSTALLAALLLAGGCEDQKALAEEHSAAQMRNGWTLLTFIRDQEGDGFVFPADHAAMKVKINRFAQSNPQLKGQLPEGGYGVSPLADFVDGDPRPHYRLLADSFDDEAGTVLMMENPALHGGERAAVLVSKGPGKIPKVAEVDGAKAAELWEGDGTVGGSDEDAASEGSAGDGAEEDAGEAPGAGGDAEAPLAGEG